MRNKHQIIQICTVPQTGGTEHVVNPIIGLTVSGELMSYQEETGNWVFVADSPTCSDIDCDEHKNNFNKVIE